MEASTATPSTPTPEPGLPDGAPQAVIAPDQNTSPAEERDALDWLLGATKALEYDLKVDYETPDGIKPLTFRFHQLDPSKIEAIDAANRKGDGPFAKLDTWGFNTELVAEATIYLQGASGRQVDIRTSEFLGGVPSPALALGIRFKYQGGLLEGIADQIRAVSGYSTDRIGTAQRALVEAGKD